MKLALNLATRGRPHLLVQTVMRTLDNVRDPSTVLMVSADQDDRPTVDMLGTLEAIGISPDRLKLSVLPREDTIAEKWNRVLQVVPDADIYMPMCDDGPAVTAGFDMKVARAAAIFPDGIGVVTNYLENLTFPGIQAVTARLALLMGYIYPPYFPYWFVDHWLLDITRMIGRDAFADVQLDCETNRPATQEKREPGWWGTAYDALYLMRRRQACGILAAMSAPPWQKAMLEGYFPCHEQHSKMINDLCRMRNDPGPAPDERYLRVKARMVEMLRAELGAIAADQAPEQAAA